MFDGRLARYILADGLRTVAIEIALAYRAPRLTAGLVDETLEVQLVLVDERKETQV